MKCINHPKLDAEGVCEKCGKGLCFDCKREIHGKIYCQPCAQEILAQEKSTTPPLANNKRKTSGNRVKTRYLKYLNIVALLCFILGFVFAVVIPLGQLGGVDTPSEEINKMTYIGLTFAIAGIVLTLLSLYLHLAIIIGLKWAILLGIILVIFGAVFIVKSHEETIPTMIIPCGEGYSYAINRPYHCCPNGSLYYWSSDGQCHTSPPPTPTATPPSYTLTVIYKYCCWSYLERGADCPPASWHCDSAGGNVTVFPNESTYQAGTSVTLTAVPASGRRFGGWDGDVFGYSTTITVYMDSNKTIYASFANAW